MTTDIVDAEIIDEITGPGVYDLPEDVYHADPAPGGSLSVSGAKLLLPPSCPALYKHRRDHPRTSDAFDFGTAAHKYVLGAGAEIAVVNADDWRTKGAREVRGEIRASGRTPLLIADHDKAQAMADEIRAHPLAGALFGRHGAAEQSLFWTDAETGIWRRARLDWLLPGLRVVIVDYKTTAAADRDSIRRHVANYGYHMQAAWYTDAVQALGLGDDPAFLFVFQEKTPPYLVNVVQLDGAAIRAGRDRCRRACEIWRDCTEAGDWPGYEPPVPGDIELITLPPWAAHSEEYA